VAVAVAAWLADLSWPAVVGVMALALGIAWLVEWVSWREAQTARLAAPRPDRHLMVEDAPPEPPPAPEPEPEPDPESPPVVETAPPPVVEPVPEPVVVEADHDSANAPPVAAEEPEPAVPEAVESAPETEPVESGAEPEPEPRETSMPDELEAPAPKARRSWRGMSLRRVEPAGATTPGEPPAPVERDRIEFPEPSTTASEPRRPVEVESGPEAEERPPYPPPRGVPQPPPDEVAPVAPAAPRAPENVVRMPQSVIPREWNLWDLESLAREQARLEPERGEEWSYLFVHLRQFADVKGKLPSEFDGLVRESFGELLETLEPV
jgi:hypothetical protein